MRVLILDRGIGNPYSLGLASGLRALGVDLALGGPIGTDAPGVTGVYPVYGVAGRRVRKTLQHVPSVVRFIRLLRTFDPDVVHIQWPGHLDLLYARAARQIRDQALVFTAHNPTEAGRRLGPMERRQAVLLALADAVVTHGPELARLLAEADPNLDGRVHHVEHGSYAHVVQPFPRAYARRKLGLDANGGPVYAFIGQVRPRKGLEILLDAFARHRATGGQGELVVVGTATMPGYYDMLRDRARALGVEVRWVVACDHLPQTALDLAASAATQVVLPFVSATQSGSVIYAMTHGRCIVTTCVGEVERTLGCHGIVVPPGDAQAVADALRLAQDDPSECARLGREAQRRAVEDLAWTRIAADTVSVYRSACDARARAGRADLVLSA